MRVVRHYDFDGFLAAVAPMRSRGEASASFFEGGAYSMKRTPPRPGERVYLATCAAPGVFGAAMLRDEGPVIIGESDTEAGAAFAADLSPDWPKLRGVVGAPHGCDAFVRTWKDLTGRACRLRVRLRQHVLTTVNVVPEATGAARIATSADADWLIERQVAFIEEVGMPDPPARLRGIMPPRIERGDFRIWDDGRPVAYAGYNDAAPEFARIAPVYTLPDCRGHGYATSLVAALSRELMERGKDKLFLTTDVDNPTSNAIYARIGFRPENDDCGFDFIAPDSWAMGAPRFLSTVALAPELAGRTIELDEASAHHATRVLRLAIGDALTLFDGTGGEYAATLVRAGKRGAAVRVERFLPVERESPLALTLAQSIVASDAMDSAVRKATELGITAIQPLVTARSAPLPDGERGEKRVGHWRQIAAAAAEQSGRNRIPQVAAPLALAEWLSKWPGTGIVLLPDADISLARIALPAPPLAVVIGPEGGFDGRESAAAKARGFQGLRLGPRVLRADTAAAAAIAVVQAAWGDWR